MADRAVCARDVGVTVVLHFGAAATHTGFREVVWFVVFGVCVACPIVFARCIGTAGVVWVGAQWARQPGRMHGHPRIYMRVIG